MDVSVIIRAQLSDIEVAKVLGTSKVTAWKYRTGKAAPRDGKYAGVDLYARLRALLHILEVLLRSGDLPRPDLVLGRHTPDEVREERAALLRRIEELVNERLRAQQANT